MKKFDVAAIGSGNIDIILRIPSFPSKGGKVVGKRLDQQIGGTVANSACTMGRLGMQVASVSCVGNDYQGQAIVKDFKKFNVNCDFIREIPGMAANLAVIFIDDSGEKSLIYAPSDAHEWDEERARQAIIQSRYIYTMPSDIDKFHTLAKFCRQSETKIVVDIEPHIGSTPERLDAILSLTNIAIFNRDGFVAGCGEEPNIKNLQRLQHCYQLDAVVVTLDAKGVIAVTDQESEILPCFDVPVIDTTGAGDTFNGAFIYSVINNKRLKEALEFSSATAAINISALGARGKLPTADEVYRFLSIRK